MRWADGLRGVLRRALLGDEPLTLSNAPGSVEEQLADMDSVGLYVHIPFCRQICPYCPYNKELYDEGLAEAYADAVVRQAERYGAMASGLPVTSVYIGGGTPTTMLGSGLARILTAIHRRFNVRCGVHSESHPNDLSATNLRRLKALGVAYLSMGIEALQDRHLRTLRRPYTAAEGRAVIERAVAAGFRCVNVDLIFALPHQTHEELRGAARELIELGVDQVAAYPLFSFSYTGWPALARERGYPRYNVWQKRRMLRTLERVFYGAGYQRTSVWAFTRRGAPRYCSVTVPAYLGLGASAGSYLREAFWLNTFRARAYVQAVEAGRSPIALWLALSRRAQMAGWLYWRLYETRFAKSAFEERFGESLDAVYGRYLGLATMAGLLRQRGDEVRLTDRGAYWLHALQDLFSIGYVDRVWGAARSQPWPPTMPL